MPKKKKAKLVGEDKFIEKEISKKAPRSSTPLIGKGDKSADIDKKSWNQQRMGSRFDSK